MFYDDDDDYEDIEDTEYDPDAHFIIEDDENYFWYTERVSDGVDHLEEYCAQNNHRKSIEQLRKEFNF